MTQQEPNNEEPKTPDKRKRRVRPPARSKLTLWEQTIARQPATIRERLRGEVTVDSQSPEQAEYQKSRDRLPAGLQDRVDALVAEAAEDIDTGNAPTPRWCICEMPEGDFPRVKMYPKIEPLVRRLGELEGQETAVWVFYGIPLRFTLPYGKSRGRFLFLPGEIEALSIPKSEHDKPERVSAELLGHMEWQDDGWLGDPSFSEGVAEDYFVGKIKPADEDDEFEDNSPTSA